MARLTGPQEGSRVVVYTSGANAGKAVAQGESAIIYLDEALTTLADIVSTTDGAIAGSQLTVDAHSRIPLFKYPDGVDTVWTSIAGGPPIRLDARLDDRLDALATRTTALEAGGSGDLLLVHKAGVETITGDKTFSGAVVVPTPSATGHAVTKAYADGLVDNLSGVTDASAARTALGLGDSATKNTGTSAGTVAAGDDSRITGAAQKSANLSDLANAGTARSNLGLGNSATRAVGTGSGDVAAGDAPAAAQAYAIQRANHTGTQAHTTITGLGDAAAKNTGTTAGTLAAGDDTRITNRDLVLNNAAGVDPTGVAECGAAVQAAIDAASAAGVRLIGSGYYKSATGLTITDNVDLSACVLDYTGTGTAITVGALAGLAGKTIKLPHTVASAKTVSGWAQVAGSVGVKILNASYCNIYNRVVRNFEIGVLLYGDDGVGVTYNVIHPGSVTNNKVNLMFDGDGTGWTNQNTFVGGACTHDGSEGTLVAGTRHILMANSTPFVADGNVFVGTSLESPGVVEYIIESYGWYNEWRGCRWENYGAAGTKKVRWRGTSKGNVIDGGYEAHLLTVEADAGTANNRLISPYVDQSLWVPASGMVTASGAPALASYGGVPYWTLRDANLDEVAADVLIPAGWVTASITAVWASISGGAGNVVLNSKAQSLIDGVAVGFPGWAGSGTPVAAPVTAYEAQHSVAAATVTVAPGPAHVSAARDGADVGDTLASDVALLGLRIDRVA